MKSNADNSMLSPYRGMKLSLLTKHGKERVIGPILKSECECEVVLTDGYDTDQLGTFSGEIPRLGTQLEAARKKARMGMQFTGLPIGIASEGSFSTDPYAGLFSWNFELVVLLDNVRELELWGSFSGPWTAHHLESDDWGTVLRFARDAGFPDHHLVIRAETENNAELIKGIANFDDLRKAFEWATNRSPSGRVFVESDLRAFANPTRMHNIELAVRQLSRQMNSLCPSCASPGFWARKSKSGLPCRLCGQATRLPTARIWSCLKCEHTADERCLESDLADPGRCDFCNP